MGMLRAWPSIDASMHHLTVAGIQVYMQRIMTSHPHPLLSLYLYLYLFTKPGLPLFPPQ